MFITNYLRAYVCSVILIFFVLMPLRAQSDDATLINITTFQQLHAIRYDLNGDGAVSFTTAASLTGTPMFSDRAAVVRLMGADSIYAQAFTSGDFYATADGTVAATGAVAVSTTYYYKLSSAATSPYTGYELRDDLDFEDADGDGTADDKSIWAEGASGAAVSGAVAGGWAPIGNNSNKFTATLDGRGHTISNLYINRSSTDNVGLFGALGTGSNLRNLGIEGGSLSGNDNVGGLVGYNRGTITACYATGNASGSGAVGGLVGINDGGTISACYATGNAPGTGNSVGGLVGQNQGTISACYATGDASGRQSVGGLVGLNTSTISACYATGDATGTDSTVGGLVGRNFGAGVVTNSYFDSDESNRPALDDYAKTTAQLQTPAAYGTAMEIYANWNIDVDDGLAVGVDDGTAAGDPTADDPWDFGTSGQYPALKVDFDRSGTPSVAEFGTQPRTVSFRVSSFTPESGIVGATVTIRGNAFGATATDNTVVFLGAAADADNRSATVSAATASSLTVTVPTAAQTGPISVMVGAAADTSSQDYTVLIPEDKDENDNGLIEVSSLEQLDAIRYDLDGDGIPSGADPQQAAYRTAFVLSGAGAASCTGGCVGYELMSNLDFEDANGDGTADDKSIWAEGASGAGVSGAVAEGWAPIGDNSNTYTATFDGRGLTISNLYINRPSTNSIGLFGVLGTGSNVRNLGIEGGSLSGDSQVGGLVGYNDGGTIRACYATGDATGTGNSVGGLVGLSFGTISACYATGNASGRTIGGLVGRNDGTISACYATGDATGTGTTVGGLVGSSRGTIRACYATGDATGTGSDVGGLVGRNFGGGTVTNSYFDYEASNRPVADPHSKTTAQLQTPAAYGTAMEIYANWNIDVDDGLAVGVDDATMAGDSDTDDPWDFGTDSKYPALKVDFNVDGTPTALEFGGQGRAAPDALAALTATVGNAEVTLSWTAPSEGSDPITGYTIEYSLSADFASSMTAAAPAAATSYIVSGLTNGTPYYFRVAAVNAVGTAAYYPGMADAAVSATPTVPPLAISSISPTSGTVGETVTITGINFSTTATDNTVTFLGAAADADNAEAMVSTSPAPTATKLTVTVPVGAVTGKIQVAVSGEMASSTTDFTVLIGEDKDENDNGLIEVSSLEQLDAIRYDLDGDGIPSGAALEQAAYRTAFGVSGASIVVSCTGGCEGYELMNNLDFAGTKWENPTRGTFAGTRETEGWAPIGDNSNAYTATFDGNDYTISNIYIYRSSTIYVGLFGFVGINDNGTSGDTSDDQVGEIRNLGIEGGLVTSTYTASDSRMGGLVGRNAGMISDCHVTVNVEGAPPNVGGLVGENDGGTITNSHATGSVVGFDNYVGGLMGRNNGGTVTNSHAMGNVTGSGQYVGGLVGWSAGPISDCHATGSVTGFNNDVGGLVGENAGDTITNSHATGHVTGTGLTVGGLVGWNNGGAITHGYATGHVTGSGNNVGGLVGAHEGGAIRASYATGDVTGGDDNVGGLAGASKKKGATNATIRACYATGTVTGGSGSNFKTGGLVGANAEDCTIGASYAMGTVTAGSGDNLKTGGLVGQNAGTIDASYATGTVTAGSGSDSKTGGLVGENTLSGTTRASYAAGNVTAGSGSNPRTGGLVGWNAAAAAISNSYFDTDYSSQTDAIGQDNGTATNVEGKTAAELRTPTNYVDIYEFWNIDVDAGLAVGVDDATMAGDASEDDPWDFGTSSQYPALKVDIDGNGTATANEFGSQRSFRFSSTRYMFNFPVNVPTGSEVGTVAAVPADFNNTLSYTILSQTLNGSAVSHFVIVDTDRGGVRVGAISVATPSLTFTGGDTYTLSIQVTEGTGALTATTEVSIEVLSAYAMTIGEFMTCSGSFVDSGVNGDYSDDEDITMTLEPEVATDKVRVEFISFDIETSDTLYIYDGATADEAALRDKYTGTTSPGVVLSSSTDGKLAFRFVSNDSGVEPGWAATISCTSLPSAPSDLMATAGNALVGLRWTPPSDNGGAPITGYMLQYDTDMNFSSPSAMSESTLDAEPRHVVSGLTNGETYYFSVAATNAAGRGGFDAGSSGSPVSATPDASIVADYDSDDDGLIDITTLEQLYAIRYDLDGDGVVAVADEDAYAVVFPSTNATYAAISCGDGTTITTCSGYELMNDLDFKNGSTDPAIFSIWAEGSTVSEALSEGWQPIGGNYTATFEGNNYTISNLYIDRSSTNNVGLFRTLGTGGNVRNLGIEGGSLSGNNRVGGLVGENNAGTISACYATVHVTASQNDVGGLVGVNNGGTITNSHATGNVTGSGLTVGGLVGWNEGGTITNGYATGNVMGSGNNVGGLTGSNEGGAIRASYATGDVTGGENHVGGLAGVNKKQDATNATIRACYATGDVTGDEDNVGGLVGLNADDCTIGACYATGTVTAAGSGSNVNAGGLAGQNAGTIGASYATGTVTAGSGSDSKTGGLAGQNAGTIGASYATGTVTAGSGSDPRTGGLVGENAASSSISNSYFDTDYSGQTDAIGQDNGTATNVEGKTAVELRTPANYTDIYEFWNIDVDEGLAVGVDDATMAGDSDTDDPWDFGTSSQYPALKVDFGGNGTATADEFGPQRTTHFLSIRYMFDIVPGISVGSEVGTVAAVSADFNNTLSYSILSQTLNGAAVSYFVIANTASGGTNIGTISAADPAPTGAGMYTLSVEVSDGAGGTATTEVIINLPIIDLLLLMSEGEFTACAGMFMDTGGESGNYGNNENITMTISPQSVADRIRVEFTSFRVERSSCAFDRLEIHNGATTSALLIGTYCGTNSPGVVLSSSADGKLTFRFQSDGNANFSGWAATISCVPAPAVPAVPAVPAAPTALTATAGNAVVTLRWTPPSDNGGVPITGYMLQYDTDMNFSSPPTTVSITRATTSYVVSSLTNSTLYYFRVAAVNGVGTGVYYPGTGGTAVSATPDASIVADYDSDDDGLIDITTLEQLDAIRYDLDGDGAVATADEAAYAVAFPSASVTYAAISCGDGTAITACSGYELMNNLDFEDADGDGTADDLSIWAEGATAAGVSGAVAEGWVLIIGRFTATFEGNNYTISNLYIDRSSTGNVGLFRTLGTGGNVRNLGIEGGSVSGNNRVGGLVGWNEGGTISDCHATVHVTASQNDVGGLVGVNNGGTITNSHATGNVTGSGLTVGGLVGWNEGGTITNGHATGNVMGSGNNVGGLVGANEGGAIRASYATGDVTGGENHVGGLAGVNKKQGATNATISACYATGNVTGSRNNVGGLVGWNAEDCTIRACYATGGVTGDDDNVGGLVGWNADEGTIRACYATGNVNGDLRSGGLAGRNVGTISACYATGTVTAGSGSSPRAGGLVGQNTLGGTIRACYATGTVTAGSGSSPRTGGLVGQNTLGGAIRACYATGDVTGDDYNVGGLVGENILGGAISNSYFDTDYSSQTNAVGMRHGTVINVEGKTVAELQTPTAYGTGTDIYSLWNIDVDDGLAVGVDDATMAGDASADDPWDFETNSQYPALQVDFDGMSGASWEEFGEQQRISSLTVDGFSPAMGVVGETIKIWGRNFSSTAAEDSISFGGSEYVVAANFTADTRSGASPSIDTLEVNVPSDAQTGTIRVKALDGRPATSSGTFMLVSLTVVDFTPAMSAVGETIKIWGRNFSSTAAEDSISFGGSPYVVAANFTADTRSGASSSIDTLEVNVPSDARTGTIRVKALSGQPASPSRTFTVLTVLDFSPMMGAVDTEVKIWGTGFVSTATDDRISFGGSEYVVAANFIADTRSGVSPSIDTLEVNVPSDARTGKISVKVLDGMPAMSTTDFTVPGTTPAQTVVSSFTPTSGAVGETVTITGTGFSTTATDNTVTFLGAEGDDNDNVVATVSAATATLLTVTVPPDAQTGTISVMVGTAADTSDMSFSVLDPNVLAITGINPTSGTVGASVTISGQNFSTTATDNTVTFLGAEGDDNDNVVATVSAATATLLTVTVPPDAQTGKISVMVGAAADTSDMSFSVLDPNVLAITGINPTSGTVGASVTISGQNFSTTAAENTVTFLGDIDADADNVVATVFAATATLLTVTVPPDAQTGKISVMVGTAADTSAASFTVTGTTPAPDSPVVLSFTPTSGAVGATVMITGTGFSTTATENTVTFLGAEGDADNAAATVSAAIATLLTVTVPPDAQTGKISVMVGTAADTSAASFTVTGTAPAAPVVSSFSPTEGAVDTEVTITGVNFSDMSSENEVRFGGVMAAAPTSATTTSLTVRVPSGARTGRVSVAVGGQTGTSSESFTVIAPAPAAPVVSSFSPLEGEVDTEVTITGVNFSATPSENDLRFGGVMAADPTSASTTSLVVLVPSGAVTGRVSVAVGGQTGTSSENFTVTGTTPAPDPPVVLSFSPTEGVVGTSVTITGENFSATPSENDLRFGGVMAAEPTSASTTSLTILVPSGARTGSISVAVGGQTGTSSEIFTVTGTTPEPATFSVPLSSEGDVRVYPNPTSGYLHFTSKLNTGTSYKIYALVGKRVLSGTLQDDSTIDVRSLPDGQYVLTLENKENIEVLRIRVLILK